MTIEQTHMTAGAGWADGIQSSLGGVLSFFGKVILAAAIIVSAGVLAVMTAIAGLMIAGLALLMGLAGRRRRPNMPRSDANGFEAGRTLEARRTARGWTVE